MLAKNVTAICVSIYGMLETKVTKRGPSQTFEMVTNMMIQIVMKCDYNERYDSVTQREKTRTL